MATLTVHVEQAAKIVPKNKDGTSDPFCRVEFNDKVAKTVIMKKTLAPSWNFSHVFSVPPGANPKSLKVTLHHQKKKYSLGQVEVPFPDIVGQKVIDRWFKLERQVATEPLVSGSIKLKIIFKDPTSSDDSVENSSMHSSRSLKLSPRGEEDKSFTEKKDKKKKKDNDLENEGLKNEESSSSHQPLNFSLTKKLHSPPNSSAPTPLNSHRDTESKIIGTLVVHLLDAVDVLAKDLNGKSDPYAEIRFENEQRTSNIDYKTLNPVWDETFTFNVHDTNSIIYVDLYDWDKLDSPDFLGLVQIPIRTITNSDKGMEEMSLKLQKRSKKSHVSGTLNVIIEWHAKLLADELVYLVPPEKLKARRKNYDETSNLHSQKTLPKKTFARFQPAKSNTSSGSLYVNALEAKIEDIQLSNRMKDKPICCSMVIEDFSLITEPKPGPKPKWNQGKTVFHLSDKVSQLKISLYEGSEPKKQALIAKGKASILHLTRDPNQKQWCELAHPKTKEICAMVRLQWRWESDDSSNSAGNVDLHVTSARNVPDGTYTCAVLYGGSEVLVTQAASGTSPTWNEKICFPIGSSDEVQILLKEKTDVCGTHTIKLSDLQPGDCLQSWFSLDGSSGQIRLKCEVISSAGSKPEQNPLIQECMVMPTGDPKGTLEVHFERASQLPKGDYYGEVICEGSRKKTSTVQNTQNPEWETNFEFDVRSPMNSKIFIGIYNGSQEMIGCVLIPPETFKKGQIEKAFNLETSLSASLKKLTPTVYLKCIWKEKQREQEIPLPPMTDLFSLESVIDESVSAKHDYSYRVIVIGDSGVGKTNLLQRWIKSSFGKCLTTINVDWSSKTFKVNNKVVQVTFCDTAGQERYRSLTKQYFRDSSGVVLVYDITDRSSFKHIENWLDEVKSMCDPLPTMLVIGNKSDLSEQRVVSSDEAFNFAKMENLFFIEASALDGSNCTRAMQLLLQYIHSTNLKLNDPQNGPSPSTFKLGSDDNTFEQLTNDCSC
eukprot:TRINITY_DN16024_c0_g1_i1.p1 TRINITY_DN16024_c0_g1~~TRINITY_DN16024_c0_g1_i1.p1  ORF type:complete len:995 (-),score=215.70 TRINITY_DN16024_c0_g1_i1:99-3083(-)